jgi:hypothetical protein
MGLVDLAREWAYLPTMSQEEQDWQARANDPESYEKACAFRAAYGQEVPSLEAYRAECAVRAEQEMRVRRVMLTDAGREWLARNSDARLGRLVRQVGQ